MNDVVSLKNSFRYFKGKVKKHVSAETAGREIFYSFSIRKVFFL